MLRFDEDELGKIVAPIKDCSKFHSGTERIGVVAFFFSWLLRFDEDEDEPGRITSPIRDCSKFDLGTDSRERERGVDDEQVRDGKFGGILGRTEN